MSNDSNSRDFGPRLDRRGFLTGAAVAGAGLAVGGTLAPRSGEAEVVFPNDPHAFGGGGSAGGGVNRSEIDLFDCEVEGQLPADLDGTFFRVGPDPQYPKPAKYGNDIGFDGEGHVSMFRIKDGHVATERGMPARSVGKHSMRRGSRSLACIGIRSPTIRAWPDSAAAPPTRSFSITTASSSYIRRTVRRWP